HAPAPRSRSDPTTANTLRSGVLGRGLQNHHANSRALGLGIYFNGCVDGRDCRCCGDRWNAVHEDDGETTIDVDAQYDFMWHPAIYLHAIDGSVLAFTEADAAALAGVAS
ncbi:hypothetical protein AB0L20_32150, partial [Streptomyces albidoflavus]|uniref:DUF7296 family protein n=1 Tax=Streptomyces albidoflavus TaxID=1886 RepID=UPI00342D28A1